MVFSRLDVFVSFVSNKVCEKWHEKGERRLKRWLTLAGTPDVSLPFGRKASVSWLVTGRRRIALGATLSAEEGGTLIDGEAAAVPVSQGSWCGGAGGAPRLMEPLTSRTCRTVPWVPPLTTLRTSLTEMLVACTWAAHAAKDCAKSASVADRRSSAFSRACAIAPSGCDCSL